MRDILAATFKVFKETFDQNIKSFNDLQREKFGLMDTRQIELVKNTENKLEAIVAIQKGAVAEDLDVFFTSNEYFKLKSKM